MEFGYKYEIWYNVYNKEIRIIIKSQGFGFFEIELYNYVLPAPDFVYSPLYISHGSQAKAGTSISSYNCNKYCMSLSSGDYF